MRVVAQAASNNREAYRREADKAKLARREQRRREDALARQRLADRRERRRQEEAKEEEARKVESVLYGIRGSTPDAPRCPLASPGTIALASIGEPRSAQHRNAPWLHAAHLAVVPKACHDLTGRHSALQHPCQHALQLPVHAYVQRKT